MNTKAILHITIRISIRIYLFSEIYYMVISEKIKFLEKSQTFK
jgi:hypothetical protein